MLSASAAQFLTSNPNNGNALGGPNGDTWPSNGYVGTLGINIYNPTFSAQSATLWYAVFYWDSITSSWQVYQSNGRTYSIPHGNSGYYFDFTADMATGVPSTAYYLAASLYSGTVDSPGSALSGTVTGGASCPAGYEDPLPKPESPPGTDPGPDLPNTPPPLPPSGPIGPGTSYYPTPPLTPIIGD